MFQTSLPHSLMMILLCVLDLEMRLAQRKKDFQECWHRKRTSMESLQSYFQQSLSLTLVEKALCIWSCICGSHHACPYKIPLIMDCVTTVITHTLLPIIAVQHVHSWDTPKDTQWIPLSHFLSDLIKSVSVVPHGAQLYEHTNKSQLLHLEVKFL